MNKDVALLKFAVPPWTATARFSIDGAKQLQSEAELKRYLISANIHRRPADTVDYSQTYSTSIIKEANEL